MLLLAVGAYALARAAPAAFPGLPVHPAIAAALACAGLALNGLPKRVFRRAGTTVNPLHPARTTQLVTHGIYRYTRNPMYLGHALLLLAWACYLQHALALMAVPLYVSYVSRFQIRPEERALAGRFTETYASYCWQTRSWL
ncbi:methyltransferase family protein [Xanthomonas floridensis]|uniref:Isoprenylcysteine carboxylmethyltransferase family protein n=1 Tax=Xanthomonas floridensis TaxID=1843580 RepID=A0A1A9M7T9_9XANT|nr:isoprenylcysteine carboxylmethyltransferase family protein [Xanthomonas floridensis]MEA5126265.1 isoprenylcysteine carboxylmethyltransferase family protein [Xanthomonas floridensis]MEA5134159.1 isoprenylcysteine carboxylmethyltransferase family protein [Xanthomonas floridensis]OAG66574.1 protein-S-isoprenylcysteine methyltransferase [Xanthomonas floridensis]